jgi:hypothetical protein
MRAVIAILVASAIAFAGWYLFFRPDGSSGQDAVDAQMEAAQDQSATAAAEDEEPLPEVVTLTSNVDEIAGLVVNAPWVHRGLEGPVLYVLSFRSCTTCAAFKEAELHGLEEAGVDVRWILYTRRDREDRQRSLPGERAVQAELWLMRDWSLFEDWYAVDPATYYETAELPPSADDDPARTAVVEEARALVDRLAQLYAENGVDLYIPALLWQEDGEWKTYVGYEESSFAPVRAALTGSSDTH